MSARTGLGGDLEPRPGEKKSELIDGCNCTSINSLFSRQVLAPDHPDLSLADMLPEATGADPLPALPNSTTAPGKAGVTWPADRNPDQRAESSSVLGTVDAGRLGLHVQPLGDVRRQGQASFCPVNSGAVAAMRWPRPARDAVHQDIASRMRDPRTNHATSTRRARRFKPRETMSSTLSLFSG